MTKRTKPSRRRAVSGTPSPYSLHLGASASRRLSVTGLAGVAAVIMMSTQAVLASASIMRTSAVYIGRAWRGASSTGRACSMAPQGEPVDEFFDRIRVESARRTPIQLTSASARRARPVSRTPRRARLQDDVQHMTEEQLEALDARLVARHQRPHDEAEATQAEPEAEAEDVRRTSGTGSPV